MAPEVGFWRQAIAPGANTIPVDGTTISFAAPDWAPLVKGRINGTIDAYFLVDLAYPTMVDPDLAAQAGLHLKKPSIVGRGAAAKADYPRFATLQLGQAIAHNVVIRRLDKFEDVSIEGTPILGVLGPDFLERFLTTFDLAKGELQLLPRSAAHAFDLGATARGAKRVPFYLLGPETTVRARLGDAAEAPFVLSLAQRNAELLVSDLGVRNAHLKLESAHAFRVETPAGATRVIPFTTRLRMGTFDDREIAGAYPPGVPITGEYDGVIGFPLFAQTRLTFDFSAMRFYVEKVKPAPSPAPAQSANPS